jgi:hypothetical protein
VLTSFDDYPIHQASVPVAHSATGDLNHYDRYFFNGYSRDGALYFAAAMGLYPNRHVADAAFSVIVDGRQHSVFRSQRAPHDRRDATSLGPIVVEVVRPLQTLRVTVEAPEHGVRADLLFESRSAALEEPHFFQRIGARTWFDYTRLTQFGAWSGWVEVAGTRHEVRPADVWGSRDRSWGVRPVGEPAASGAPVGMPQFFWLWAPVNFPSLSAHFDVNEHGDGRRWHETGALVPVGGEGELVRTVDWRVQWRPGTRWADSFEYDLHEFDGKVHTVSLRPRHEFHMRGLGYAHPTYAHGTWHGEAVTDGEVLELPVPHPTSRENLHVQALCDATLTLADGTVEHGMGILEQMCIGPHPSGLEGIFDGHRARP